MKSIVEIYGTAIAGLLLALFFVVAAPDFSALPNLVNVLKETSFLAIMSVGFTLALVTAELDLSVAEVASLAAVVTGALVHSKAPVILAVAAGLGVGIAAGVLNGIAVTVLKVPSLIATLGTAAIAKGLAFFMTQGIAFVGRWPEAFTGLARDSVLKIPNTILSMVLVSAGALFLIKWTRTGARMVATGETEEAARLAGVPTARMKRIGLGLSGLFAGVTAILLTSSLSSAAPNMAGDYFLYAIAAVLLGMTMFEPGRANIPGTLVAALTLKVLGNGLVLMGAAYYVQDIILGVIIIASVAFSATVLRESAFKL